MSFQLGFLQSKSYPKHSYLGVTQLDFLLNKHVLDDTVEGAPALLTHQYVHLLTQKYVRLYPKAFAPWGECLGLQIENANWKFRDGSSHKRILMLLVEYKQTCVYLRLYKPSFQWICNFLSSSGNCPV